MGTLFVSVGVGLSCLLVCYVIGSALSEPKSVDPEDDEEDEDDTDLHVPTRLKYPCSADSGVWLRCQMGWSAGDRFPCGQNWKRPA